MSMNNTQQEAIIELYGKNNGWSGHGAFINKAIGEYHVTIGMKLIGEDASQVAVWTVTGTREMFGKRWACQTPIFFNSLDELSIQMDNILRVMENNYTKCRELVRQNPAKYKL